MAKLLTDADFAEIRTAINDVVETFAQLPITYKKLKRRTLSRFNRETTSNQSFTDYSFNALEVWEKNEKGFDKADEKGIWDFSEGYLLIAFDEVIAKGLIDTNGNLAMESEVDKVVIRTIQYDIVGIVKIGQLKDQEVLVKIQFKKPLKNG